MVKLLGVTFEGRDLYTQIGIRINQVEREELEKTDPAVVGKMGKTAFVHAVREGELTNLLREAISQIERLQKSPVGI